VAYPQTEIWKQTIFKVGRLMIVFGDGVWTLGKLQNGCKDFVKNFTSPLFLWVISRRMSTMKRLISTREKPFPEK